MAVIDGDIGYQVKRLELKIVIDPKEFKPCHPKEVTEWSHRRLKNEKWIVHFTTDGRLTKSKLSS